MGIWGRMDVRLLRAKAQHLAVDFVVAILAGLFTPLLVKVFQRADLDSPLVLVLLSLVVVVTSVVIIGMGLRRGLRRGASFWALAGAAIGIAVLVLYVSTVRVPRLVGMSLGAARSALLSIGLKPEEKEMLKGGARDVAIQIPEAGVLRFKGSRVALLFGQAPTVFISEPKNGSPVSGHRAMVRGQSEGVFGSEDFFIRIIVRSQDNKDWVQDPPLVEADGTFSVYAHFGSPDLGRGESFCIRAIVSTKPIEPGEGGPEIGRAVASSPTIVVQRTD